MAQRYEHKSRKHDGPAPAPPFYDRALDPFEEARIRRLYARGHTAYTIANLLRRRYATVQELCERVESDVRGQRTDDKKERGKTNLGADLRALG